MSNEAGICFTYGNLCVSMLSSPVCSTACSRRNPSLGFQQPISVPIDLTLIVTVEKRSPRLDRSGRVSLVHTHT